MKPYPSIPKPEANKEQALVFEKYDGSNLRFEWSKKQGWHKFGTRTRLFDKNDPDFGSAIELFQNTVQEQVEKLTIDNFKAKERFIAYFEFFGEESFAGKHKPNDPKKLVLLDVDIYKQCFVSPKDFVRVYSEQMENAAKFLYSGQITEDFIQSVREGMFPVFEGVICKWGERHNIKRMKIKTHKYLEKLKEMYADNWQSFWE